jgi:hypothetical protein
MDRTRRGLLGAVAGAGATAGCLGSALDGVPYLGREPVLLRAMRADPEATDATCDLPRSVAEAHPELAEILRAAENVPRGEWAKTDVSKDTGAAIFSALEETCGEDAGGLLHYRDEWYFVSVSFRNAEDAAEHHSDNHSHTR